LTAPVIDDPDWDWIPVTAGAEVAEGDTVLWAVGYQFVVDGIATAPNAEGGTSYTFDDGASLSVVVDVPPLLGGLQYDRTQYLVTPHPAVGDEFTHQDGSRWVFQASKTYRCFTGSSTYPAGTVLPRVAIDGSWVASQ